MRPVSQYLLVSLVSHQSHFQIGILVVRCDSASLLQCLLRPNYLQHLELILLTVFLLL